MRGARAEAPGKKGGSHCIGRATDGRRMQFGKVPQRIDGAGARNLESGTGKRAARIGSRTSRQRARPYFLRNRSAKRARRGTNIGRSRRLS